MKTLKTIAAFLLLVTTVSSTFAQSNVLDGVYVKEHTPERKVVPYTHLREADVMWSKRIWRVMDLREKINHNFYFPVQEINNRRSLIQVVMDGILDDGTITAYNSLDDEFKQPMTKAEIQAMISKVDTLTVENIDTGIPETKIVPREFDPASVKKFRIKEDWFFDKQKSVLEVRIIGICPVQEVYNDDGSFKGDNPMFWIYFPEARYTFANAEVFNTHNDAERRTYEDIFWKRMFGSYVYKEQNVFDRKISEYSAGMDALLESERIKEDIMFLEHDLWEF